MKGKWREITFQDNPQSRKIFEGKFDGVCHLRRGWRCHVRRPPWTRHQEWSSSTLEIILVDNEPIMAPRPFQMDHSKWNPWSRLEAKNQNRRRDLYQMTSTETYRWKECNIIPSIGGMLTSHVFWSIPDISVYWPQLCLPKLGNMSRIRIEHKCHNAPRKIAARLGQWWLKNAVSLQKCFWCNDFAVDALFLLRLPGWDPMFFEGMPMVILGGRSRGCLLDYVDEAAVVKVRHIILSACWKFILGVRVVFRPIMGSSSIPPPLCCSLASGSFRVLFACRDIDWNCGYLPTICFGDPARIICQFAV